MAIKQESTKGLRVDLEEARKRFLRHVYMLLKKRHARIETYLTFDEWIVYKSFEQTFSTKLSEPSRRVRMQLVLEEAAHISPPIQYGEKQQLRWVSEGLTELFREDGYTIAVSVQSFDDGKGPTIYFYKK